MDYNKKAHSVYLLTYHIVFVTKYRRPVIREVRRTYPEHVKKYLWGDAPFWSNSYFIASTGTTSLENVTEYIEGQHTEEHKRKYVKSGKYKKKRN